MRRIVGGGLKLLLALAFLGALVYVGVFVIGDQYRFDDVKRGTFQSGPRIGGKGDRRTFQIGLAIANRGDRKVEIREVGGIKGNALTRVRARMGKPEGKAPARKLKRFSPFELEPGDQREVRLVARFRCSEIGKDERIVIDSLEVKYKVGFFEKKENLRLIRRVRVGQRRARC